MLYSVPHFVLQDGDLGLNIMFGMDVVVRWRGRSSRAVPRASGRSGENSGGVRVRVRLATHCALDQGVVSRYVPSS